MPRSRPALFVTVLLSLMIGCVERKERITVEPDGTVRMKVSYSTHGYHELYEGDAVPSLAGGWLVQEWVDVDGEGKQVYRLTAEASFPPDGDLPQNYADPRDTRAELNLQFPTRLEIEPRLDGTYYHFYRRYPERPWAQIEALEKRLLHERLEDSGLKDKKAEDLTREERILLIQAFAEFETAKMLTFARAAFRDVTPDTPQDGWLAVRRGMTRFTQEIDYVAIAELMGTDDDEQRNQALESEAEEYEKAARRQLRTTLRDDCGYSRARMEEFMRRYEWHERHYDITHELGDDSFEITVEMPGEIVGSNAGSTEANRATWRFDGGVFHDRDLELMVSSRVRD